jgi:hypothetical protein
MFSSLHLLSYIWLFHLILLKTFGDSITDYIESHLKIIGSTLLNYTCAPQSRTRFNQTGRKSKVVSIHPDAMDFAKQFGIW